MWCGAAQHTAGAGTSRLPRCDWLPAHTAGDCIARRGWLLLPSIARLPAGKILMKGAIKRGYTQKAPAAAARRRLAPHRARQARRAQQAQQAQRPRRACPLGTDTPLGPPQAACRAAAQSLRVAREGGRGDTGRHVSREGDRGQRPTYRALSTCTFEQQPFSRHATPQRSAARLARHTIQQPQHSAAHSSANHRGGGADGAKRWPSASHSLPDVQRSTAQHSTAGSPLGAGRMGAKRWPSGKEMNLRWPGATRAGLSTARGGDDWGSSK